MSTVFPTIDDAVYEAALSSPNATVAALAPVVKNVHFAKAQAIAERLQSVSKAAETAEADLPTSDVEAATEYREALSVHEGNEEKYAAKKAAAKEAYDAAIKKIEDSFAPLKENRAKLRELKSTAVRAIASQKVSEVDTSADVEEYKSVAGLLKGISDAIALSLKEDKKLSDSDRETLAKLVPHLPTVTALTSSRKSLASAIKGEGGGWRPRFEAAIVNGETIPNVTNAKGKVSTRLQDVANKVGVHRDNLVGRLENLLGGRVFTDASLNAEGYFTFEVDNAAGNTVSVSVKPAVKNEADNAPEEDSVAA